jgi:16S rRNA (guanine527-N7)-methyltransferase
MPEQILADGIARTGIPENLQETVTQCMECYIREIELFNAAWDLVAANSREDLVVRHILDSLAGYIPLTQLLNTLRQRIAGAEHRKLNIVDVGSGAGLPGIPLAAALPDCQFVLLERMSKRCAFLENCIAVTGLGNVTVINTEAEQAEQETFDLVTFRAFRPLDIKMTKTLLSLCKPGGFLAAYKAKRDKIDTEMHGIATLIPQFAVIPLHVPFLPPEYERHLVVMEKQV